MPSPKRPRPAALALFGLVLAALTPGPSWGEVRGGGPTPAAGAAGAGDASNLRVAPTGVPLARSTASRARDSVSVKDYGAIADGASHPVSEWVSSGRYASLAAIQADYPHVTALGDEIDWAAVQAAADAPVVGGLNTTLRLASGKLILNRDVRLTPGQREVRGEGSGATEVRFTGGSKGFAFEGAGPADRIQFQGLAVSTAQAGLGTAFTVRFAGTQAATQQALFREITVLASGGFFKHATHLTNVRSPAYAGVFVTGSLASPGMEAAHVFRGTTTDIRFSGSFVLSARVGFDIGELCEGLMLNDSIAIAVDIGVKANFLKGKPWIQVNGGQIAAYRFGIDAHNAKQIHVIGTTMYAATYEPGRMATYVGINLTGADTRNVFVRGNYFQADGYRVPPAPAATARTVMAVEAGAYGLVADNQFSGFDRGVVLAAGTTDWRVIGNMNLSVTTPFADSGTANVYQDATAGGRIVLGAGGYVEDLSGATSAQIKLHDRGAGPNLKGAATLLDDGAIYHRLLNDDDAVKREYLSANAARVRLGGNGDATAALSTDYEGNTYLIVGGVEKRVSIGAPDSAGKGFRTLRIPN